MVAFRRAAAADVGALVDFRIEFMRSVKAIDAEAERAWKVELAALFAHELASGALRAWVAVEGGEPDGSRRIVGASGLAPGRGRRPGEGEILNMYTLPEFRRRGIGRVLLGLAIEDAREAGLSRLRLQPTDEGRPLYESAGFRDEGREMALELRPHALVRDAGADGGRE